MKPSDVMLDLGRPLAFYSGLRRITGSLAASVLFSQLFYWHGKGKVYEDDWFYKSAAELTEETSLSYTEQVTARKLLVARGLIEERYERLDHRMCFRVKIAALDAALEASAKSVSAESDKVPELSPAKLGNSDALSSSDEPQTTVAETTPIEPRVPKSNKPVKRSKPVMSIPPTVPPASPGNGADRGTGLADKPIPVATPARPVSDACNKPPGGIGNRSPTAGNAGVRPLAPLGMRSPESDPQVRVRQQARERQQTD